VKFAVNVVILILTEKSQWTTSAQTVRMIIKLKYESRLKMKITKFEKIEKEKSLFEQAVELVRIQAEKILKEQR